MPRTHHAGPTTPDPPRQPAAQPDPPEVRDTGALADGGKVPLVAIHERRQGWLTAQTRPDHAPDMGALLLCRWCDAGNRAAVRHRNRGGITDDKDLWPPLDGQVTVNRHPATAIPFTRAPITR